MNKETCSAAGSASCPDYFGTLPSCAGLAVPYVPFQQNGSQKYSQGDALSNGTLFPGLNLPFHLKVEGSTLPSNPLVELQALEFVVLELGIYLDTHPEDEEARAYFEEKSALRNEALDEYAHCYGPLTIDTANDTCSRSWEWVNQPWPWELNKKGGCR